MKSALQSRRWIWGLLLLCLVALAYSPALHSGFIWDDDSYVTENLTLRNLRGLRQIWFTPAATPQYYPLVHTSFWLEYHFWGLAPHGYHVVNLLLHILAAWLLYKVLARLVVPGAWLAAAIFMLHPVQVESVAWVTERKNVLSGVFYFASALAYLRFAPLDSREDDNKSRWNWYALSLLLFVMALLSKTVTCTLPVALLLARWWKTGKLRWADVYLLAPFLAIGAAFGTSTAWLEQHHVGAEGPEWMLTPAQRFLIAGRALWFYAGKLIWPVHLTFVYPRWNVDASAMWQWLFPIAAIGVVVALWRMRRRIGRAPIAAVLFFAITLSPALGFINVYPMRFSFVADHYQYLATVGLITLFAAWAIRWPQWLPALLLVVLVLLTRQQAGMYRDSETLWQTTLARNPTAFLADNGLGVILLKQGDAQGALTHFQRALETNPDYAEARCNIGLILFRNGQMDDAGAQFQKALETEPNSNVALNGLGSVLLRQGHVDDAIAQFQKAVALNPADINARLNLGVALAQQGRFDDAIPQFETCLVLQPDNAAAHANLGNLFLRKGSIADAVKHYSSALALQPNDAAILNDLAWIRAANSQAQFRNGAEAVTLAERACQITNYKVPVIINTLAAAYAEAGRFDDAVAAEEKARQLAIEMGHPDAADKLLETIQLYKSRRAYHEPIAN
jgi:Flp pilus assembly protein TadD